MESAGPSEKQRARQISLQNFYLRIPEHARNPATWMRYLQLVRSMYTAPFSALISLDADGIQVINWADSRLDDIFSEYVDMLEAEAGIAQALSAPRPANAAIVSGDWTCIRISFFQAAPMIAVAVFTADIIDTAALHSFENVLSDFLISQTDHESEAPVSWGNKGHGAAN